MKRIKILVACEESQAVCKAFRENGHEAYSCDIVECSGGHPEWHIMQDVLPLLNGNCSFETSDGEVHTVDGKWDMILAFPPCTYLTVTGNVWFNCARYGDKAQSRWNNRCIAICFFLSIAYANCERIAIENPIGVMSTYYRKPEQVIQPWWFGDNAGKSTCLWLKVITHLKQEVFERPPVEYHEWLSKDGKKKRQEMWFYETRCLPHSERGKAASKTFPGIARAMAEQWGK